MTPVLELIDVAFSYPERPILKDINLKVEEGDFVAIVGENGSGKSTLLKMVIQDLKAQSGQIRLFGDPIDRNNHFKEIAYISQEGVFATRIFPTTVNEVIVNHLLFLKKDPNPLPYLKAMGLSDCRHQALSELSGGQLQRLAILLALVKDARLILLDEPTSGIDKKYSQEVFSLLKDLSRQGRTIVLVTHALSQVQVFADHVFHLENGKGHLCHVENWKGMVMES